MISEIAAKPPTATSHDLLIMPFTQITTISMF